jgi:hypothetical protein
MQHSYMSIQLGFAIRKRFLLSVFPRQMVGRLKSLSEAMAGIRPIMQAFGII